jgi:predicted RNA-binding Zn-ribbon protein involved in translation (DUF1610 family)
MTEAPITKFARPECGSAYKVVRLPTPPERRDHPVPCLSCGRVLAPRDNGFLVQLRPC